MMFQKIHDVHVRVSNMQRAVSFYYDVLNLKMIEQGPHWTAFQLGDVKLGLKWTGGKPVPRIGRTDGEPDAGAVITFEVHDIFTAYDHLREQGVRFLHEIEEITGGSVIAFEDPDGNVLRMVQIGQA